MPLKFRFWTHTSMFTLVAFWAFFLYFCVSSRQIIVNTTYESGGHRGQNKRQGNLGLSCCGNSSHIELVPSGNGKAPILRWVGTITTWAESSMCYRKHTIGRNFIVWKIYLWKTRLTTRTGRLVACWVGRESFWSKNCWSCTNMDVTIRWCNSTEEYESTSPSLHSGRVIWAQWSHTPIKASIKPCSTQWYLFNGTNSFTLSLPP